MAELDGFKTSVAMYATSQVIDTVTKRKGLLGAMANLDIKYNRVAGLDQTIATGLIKAGKMAYGAVVAKPTWSGVNARDEDIIARTLPMSKQTKILRGEIQAAAGHFGERIDKKVIDALDYSQDPNSPYANHVKKVGDWSVEGYWDFANGQLFPLVNQVGGDSATGQTKEDTILAFAYPLQSGYANNAATGSGTYNYLSFDMNLYPLMKAVNAGTAGSGFVPTPSNIRTKLLQPLASRKNGNVDLCLVDGDTWEYLYGQSRATVFQTPDREQYSFGPYAFELFPGVMCIWEPQLDALYAATSVREMYIGDSSVLKFGMRETPLSSIDLIDKVPGIPTAVFMQGWEEHQFVNEDPSRWARGYNLQLP